MKVLCGIPTRGVIFTDTVDRLFKIVKGHQADMILAQIAPVSDARNYIVDQLLQGDTDYLFMLDDDEVPPVNILDLMEKAMVNQNADVVVVDAPAKRTGKSNIFKNKDGSIAATGFGCALFKKVIFERIQPPWFDLMPRRRVERVNGLWQFPIIEDALANDWGGEDINFSLKLLDYGFKIIDLSNLICEHLEYEPFSTEQRATKILYIKRYSEITGPPL